jgi:hypothetical protein
VRIFELSGIPSQTLEMNGRSLFKLLRAPDKLIPWHQRTTIDIMQCSADKTKRQLQSSATNAEYESENGMCRFGFETVYEFQ